MGAEVQRLAERPPVVTLLAATEAAGATPPQPPANAR
jgi:hypothetical protein